MKLSKPKSPEYFDLTVRQISEVALFEKNDKSTCYIALKSDSSEFFKGFKLTDNPLINVVIDLTFYKSSSSDRYVPRLILSKVDKNFATKDRTLREKVIFELDDSQTAENFWQVVAFLSNFKELVDHDAFQKSYKVIDATTYILEFDSKEKAEKVKVLSELVEKSDFSESQIEEILKQNRLKTLEGFNQLLTDASIVEKYRGWYKDEVKGAGEEVVWHHFLKKHHWLLGLNADLRFIQDLIPEGNVGIASTEDRGSPNADFIGIMDFTMLVEVKTPKTKIFSTRKKATSRANTWSFSDDFIDGISQCLGQKFSWDKSSESKKLVDDGEVLDQNKIRTIDPKIIFLVGNRGEEFPEDSTSVDNLTKRDTFERFRRNSRNVEILTFDELYARAYYIVHNESRKQSDNKPVAVPVAAIAGKNTVVASVAQAAAAEPKSTVVEPLVTAEKTPW